jgi:MFS family permease
MGEKANQDYDWPTNRTGPPKMAKTPGFQTAWRTFSEPNFRNYITGNFVSQVGLWTQRIGVQWLTWELTKDPFWLGMIAFAEFFPIVVMSPLGGAMADRLHPLTALKSYIVVAACISATIAYLTITGQITVELLFVLALANGAVMGFNYPLRVSIVHRLVGREALTSAISLNSVGFSISRIGGPALAGIIIAKWGVGPAVSFTVFADIIFIIALFFVTLIGKGRGSAQSPLKEIPGEIMEGFRYVLNHPGISRLMIILVLTSVFARPFTDLFAGFADQVFGRGADGLAWLTSAQGIGAAISSVVLAGYAGVAGLTRKMVFYVLILALGVAGFVASDIFWIALLATALTGYALVMVGVIEQSLMQAPVAIAMRGRVASVYIAFSRGCPAFGALLMGWLASFYGMRAPIAGGAVICIILWIWAKRHETSMAETLEAEPEES